MTTLRSRLAVSALLVALASAVNAGSIQKWVDAEGKVHYGDRPPATVMAREVKIHKGAEVPADKRVDISPQAQLKRLLGVPERTDDLASVPVGEELAVSDTPK